jgi:dienelactone hydrolase
MMNGGTAASDESRRPVGARLRSGMGAVAGFLRPWPRAWRGAAAGVVLLVLLLALYRGGELRPWPWVFALWALLLFGLSAALANLILDVLLPRLPVLYRNLAIGAAVVLLAMFLGNIALPGQIILALAVLLGASLLGGGAARLLAARAGPRGSLLQPALAALLGAALLVTLLLLYRWPGPDVEPATRFAPAEVALPAQNPAQPGPYAVGTLVYGSGDDRRPLYDQPDLQSRQVDGRAFVANWSGLNGDLRSRYWGFDDTALPLNGRVWYPAGEGPFPLVLMVHGNHEMTAPSEAGYAYLGELLASRGIIAVSVDENFLNGSWTDRLPFGQDNGLREENDARGWLLLEHLQQWREWNEEEENPFAGRVDLERVGLIGHSRGGEAVAIAAAFNRLPHYPDNALRRFDYGFGIRAVVAIAQVDGQYRPGGRGTPLEGVSYLALQGAYDGDLYYFDGMSQYHRLSFAGAPDAFKAAVFVDQANHGQFNTEWGRADRTGFPTPGLLNLGPIMDGEAQRQLAKLFIGGFLEATLHERDEYRVLFQQPGAAAPWLPEVAYRTRYDDPQTATLANFDEDLDLRTATAPGVTLQAEGLAGWKEAMAPLKSGDQGSAALWLRWDGGGRYTVMLEGEAARPGAGATLALALAAGQTVSEPVDFTVLLVDAAGREAQLPLSAVAPLPPQIPFNPWKHDLLSRISTTGEPVFQSYWLPLDDFDGEAGFDAGELAEIAFLFDQSERGEMWVDEIGWR